MLSSEEYERIIRVFLVELNHRCMDISEGELVAMPALNREIEDYVSGLRDPEKDAAQTLRVAFAYLDEYIHADWSRVTKAGYDAYVLAESRRARSDEKRRD